MQGYIYETGYKGACGRTAYLAPLSSSHRAQQHSVRLLVHAYGDALVVVGDSDGGNEVGGGGGDDDDCDGEGDDDYGGSVDK